MLSHPIWIYTLYSLILFVFALTAVRLTVKERKRLEYKEKVLSLAKDHKSAGEIEKVDRYVIPDADQVVVFIEFV